MFSGSFSFFPGVRLSVWRLFPVVSACERGGDAEGQALGRQRSVLNLLEAVVAGVVTPIREDGAIRVGIAGRRDIEI